MSKNKVVHFEIPATDFNKSKKFYESVFDWKIEIHGEEGAMAHTTETDKNEMPTEPGAINGGFYKRTSKSEHPSFAVRTDNIDETIKKIEKAGGKITGPKHPAGEWGFMADFKDPEGNEMALWEPPERMK